MGKHDVVVVGGGISGLAFAESAAKAGRSVVVLEEAPQVGGCLATHRGPGGFWFELGAHTCYNSYAGLAGLLERCGLRGAVLPRARTHLRFLEGDRLVPGSNLGSLLRLFAWRELARSLPRAFTARKEGQTVYSYYASIVGRKNYARVLGPMLAAVPSQSADAFPAAMLFKSRPLRRKDLPRSFTVERGLATVAETIARQPGIELRTGTAVAAVEGGAGGPYAAVTAAGERVEGAVLAVATPPAAAAALLRGCAPELSIQVARVGQATVETLAFAAPSSKVDLPPSTFLVPRDDLFHSVVSRDPIPDREWRGFAFHFRPGLGRDVRMTRALQVLRLRPGDVSDVVERRTVLPSPVLGHEQVVAEVDRLTAGTRLVVAGNWFAGLSIEDCVERARGEWERVAAIA